MNRLQLFCLALAFVLLNALVARADDRTRITLALGQQALVEQMGASACFAMGGIDAARQSAATLEAVDLFRTTLDAFATGHEWMGIEAATADSDLARIAAVQVDWDAYAPAYRQILAGDLHGIVMTQLLDGAAPIGTISTALSEHFIAQAAADAVDSAILPALRLAARQRVLTQRALRQMCLLRLGLAGASMQAALRETLAQIRQGADHLARGHGLVVAPPDGRIARNLRTADLFWSKIEPVIDAVAAGGPVEDSDIAKALKFNTSVQKQLIQAVQGYAAARG